MAPDFDGTDDDIAHGDGRTRPAINLRWLASGGVAVLALLLGGCPSNTDELFDKSRINGARALPNPVPPPPSDRQASNFVLRVDFDSNRDNDRLHVYVRNPSRNNAWEMLAEHDPCRSGNDSGGCGLATKDIECLSALIDAPDGTRLVNCGYGPSSQHLRPGTHRFRIDIIGCTHLGFGCNDTADDTIEFDVRLD